ncbi:snRNA-activating protein complex subunit-like isoform X3 [Cucumis melo var. makuwa]|uniref:snRNA-activating protein complex subunit-like isoform X3 n=1 Tax=Cucumis melo var. makuwa TaxID=1194695 RepID=A0A5D3E0W6_CUCMM|nr:snRNA-activating protein complex subunit-like isoform X3 [Cucumis melo var. makuwa]
MEARDRAGASDEIGLNGDGLSIPLGGPIYAPNLVGPLTRVPHFESSVVQEFQSLEAELHLDSSQLCDEDISIDELKLFTEEQLLNMALEESLQSDENANNQSELPEENMNAGLLSKVRNLYLEFIFACHENLNLYGIVESKCEKIVPAVLEATFLARCIVRSLIILRKNGILRECEEEVNGHNLEADPASNANRSTNKMTTRKRKKEELSIIEEKSIAKVAEIAKLKQKQEADRAVVQLHAFKWKKDIASSSSESKERLKSLRSTNTSAKVKSLNDGKHESLHHPMTVLFVEVYHKSRKMVKSQEFLALGRQTLAELKDKIYCSTDTLMQKAEQQDSSGYFLVEDVFCNDLRNPSAIDYSKPILDWLRNSEDEARKKWECIITGELQQKNSVVGEVSDLHVPHFRSVSMSKVRFCDLKFRLGAGYLYCHQGDCKHTIVIRDMRLIHPEDVHDRAAYPIVTFQLRTRAQKCDVCNIYRAKKVTLDDKWAQENPCYFCEDCYFLLHYSKEGNLLYNDFVVHDYLQD